MKPGFGETNLGALAGGVTGSIGGLFTPGIVQVFFSGIFSELFSTPILGILSFVVCGTIGWIAGGQIGVRLGQRFHAPKWEIVGGIAGGLAPVLLVAVWACYMAGRPA
ncbi:MAG TPA: hypothetical protein VN673_18415 [Clostridia bacterium]|nr:hypothetical protein [Clostridia bacterium]